MTATTMGEVRLSPRELAVLRHATGWDRLSPHKRKTITSRDDLDRNHFVTGESCWDWELLNGLAQSSLVLLSHRINDGRDSVFHVTETGFKAMVSYLRPGGAW